MFFKILTWVFLGLVLQYLFKIVLFLDLNKRVYNHRPGTCREVKGPIHGSEDLEIIETKNIAFITSGVVYLPENPNNITWKGQIFKYDLSNKDYVAEPVKVVDLEDEEGFYPHGISHWILEDGTIRLFLVTHTKHFSHAIVILDYNESQNVLRHVKTIRNEKIYRPNDIAATGANSFFVSNDGSAQNALLSVLEVLSGLDGGSVVYYDGTKTKYLIERTSANGISISKDLTTLFVSHINEEIIGVYTWNKDTLKEVSKISTLSACDNFYIDGRNLWTGCHPVLKDAAEHLANPIDHRHNAPSQVLLAKFSEDFKTAQIIELLADDGNFISASSIAAPFDLNRQLLIGTVGRKFYHCDINVPIDF
ncbi:unnamed protein product [Caenorhabditis angaria]|uniref:Arylesterase n=1 Tax=Caenorhabditis angaria TaxID=860376 RepID=A0A9P1N943_9PELO|nr:unnamed protein product [Caenorhabditis angaria]